MTLKVTSTHVNSVQGVPISVTGIAQVRDDNDDITTSSDGLFIIY